MTNNRISLEIKYYLYILLTNLRFTRIINVLFIVQFLGLSLVQFTLFQSIFLFSQFISEVPSGLLGDILSKKKVVFIGLILLAFSPILTISSLFVYKNVIYYCLILAFIFEGMGNAFLSGADDALFFEALRNEGKEEKYGKVRGRLQLISSLTLGVATFLGGGLYSVNKLLPYVLQSITIISSGFIIFSIFEIRKVNKDSVNYSENKILKDILAIFYKMTKSPKILFMFLFTTIIVSVINVIFALLPNYFSAIGFSAATNGSLFMFYSIFGGVVATQAYRISRVPVPKLIRIISLILMISIFCQVMPSTVAFTISLLFLYIIIDILDPIIMEMLHLWVEDKARTTIISGLSFSISLVTMVMNPIVGFGVQIFEMKRAVLYISIFIFCMILFSYILIERARSGRKDEKK